MIIFLKNNIKENRELIIFYDEITLIIDVQIFIIVTFLGMQL